MDKREPLDRIPDALADAHPNDSEHKEPLAPGASAVLRAMLPWLAAAVLSLSLLSIPTVFLNSPSDLGLSAVLNYAHERGMQFGTEIVSTYGPLGFLVFPCYSPHTGAPRLIVELVVCLTEVAGLCLLAWRLRPMWRGLLLALFALTAAGVQPRLDLMMDIGFFGWGLLFFVESGRRLVGCAAMLTALAVFGGLAKISFLIVGGATVMLVSCDLLVRGRVRFALGVIGGFGAAFALGWILTGQDPQHLGSYLANGMAVASSYNQALGIEGMALGRQGGMVVGLVVLAMVLVRTAAAFPGMERRRIWRRGILTSWVAIITFTNWKHGFVRFDLYHTAGSIAFVLVLALGLEVLPMEGAVARRSGRVLAVVSGLLALALLQGLFLGRVSTTLAQPFRMLGQNCTRLLHPSVYEREMNEAMAKLGRENQLPAFRERIGNHRMDVFGQAQDRAVDNKLNFRPRPVFQSYSACNRRLMRLNEEFYLSASAPEFVLFEFGPLDSRWPPLEDAWLLRDLLIQYEQVAADKRFLLLQRRNSSHELTNATTPAAQGQPPEILQARPAESPRLTLERETTVHPGEAIDLRSYGGTNLWLEISLEPSWIGQLRQALYQPPVVRLAAWQEPGKRLILKRRAPASMMAAGFMASPLLNRTEDVAALFAGGPVTRPGAYSVELVSGEEQFWSPDVKVRIFKIENELGR